MTITNPYVTNQSINVSYNSTYNFSNPHTIEVLNVFRFTRQQVILVIMGMLQSKTHCIYKEAIYKFC